MRLEPGQVISGRYTLVEEVGSGGFGTVWRAVGRDGRPAAVKFLKPGLSGDIARRFVREADILSRLHHPHIVKFFGFEAGDPNTRAWLATEYIAGQTLGEWVFGPWTDAQRTDVTMQIADALAAAHRAGVVHRDLKPDNVMIGEHNGRPHVTVLDFGIGKILEQERQDITATGEVLGTPGHMSPEQLRADPVGPPSDLYALGTLMFLLFERRPLFEGDSALEVAMKHLTVAPPPMRGTVPAHVARLVSRLLAKQPTDRPMGAEAVMAALQSRAQTTPLTRERPRFVLAGVAVVALVGAAAAAWFAFTEPSTSPPEPTPSNRTVVAPSEPAIEPAPKRPTSPPANASAGCSGAMGARPDGVVHLPPAHDGQTPLPLLVLLHDRDQTPKAIVEEMQFLELAREEGFIVAAPVIDGNSAQVVVDFVQGVRKKHCVDESQVYGLGRGAGSEVLARLRNSSVFAAIVLTEHRPDTSAIVSGAVPTLLLTAREEVEPSRELAEQESTLREQHRCKPEPLWLPDVSGGECRSWSCPVELQSCVIDGARGADFPHQRYIWQFLSRHRRPTQQTDGCGRAWEPGAYQLLDDVVYVPDGYQPGSNVAIVFALHGHKHGPAHYLARIALHNLADEHQFLLFLPRGPIVDGEPHWYHEVPALLNFADAEFPGYHQQQLRRFDEAMQNAQEAFCVDPNRVYVIGHRDSGAFAEHLRADPRVAAVMTFSHRPIRAEQHAADYAIENPYLYVVAHDDEGKSVEGGQVTPAIDRVHHDLAQAHGCASKKHTLDRPKSDCWTWDCSVPLMTCTVSGGRYWRGARPDQPRTDFDHHRVLWDFFEAHPRRPPD